MSFFSKLLNGGNIVRAVSDTLYNLVTSDEERLEKHPEMSKAEQNKLIS